MTHPVPSSTTIIFDTRCVLCRSWVNFLLCHEADDRICFIGAWTERGLEIAARHGRSKADLDGTYLVITPSETFDRSDATVALLQHMRAPWRWLTALRFLPKPLRDAVYDVIARKRYAWFGKTNQRLEPSAATLHRFTLD